MFSVKGREITNRKLGLSAHGMWTERSFKDKFLGAFLEDGKGRWDDAWGFELISFTH